MDSNLSQLMMKMEILNLKIDSIMDNIQILKDYQKLNENRIIKMEKNIDDIIEKNKEISKLDEIKEIKESVIKMNNHIDFVEGMMGNISYYMSIKNYNPLSALKETATNLNIFKSIKDNNRPFLEREIREDDKEN